MACLKVLLKTVLCELPLALGSHDPSIKDEKVQGLVPLVECRAEALNTLERRQLDLHCFYCCKCLSRLTNLNISEILHLCKVLLLADQTCMFDNDGTDLALFSGEG